MASTASRSRRSAKAAPSVDPSRIIVITWPEELPAIAHVAASPELAQAWCAGFNARDTEFFQAAPISNSPLDARLRATAWNRSRGI